MNKNEPPAKGTNSLTLSVVATPHTPLESLTPALRHLGWDKNQAYNANSQPPKGPLLLIHTRPEWALAWAMEEGDELEEALKTWQEQAQKLLGTFRERRADAAMVDAQAAAEKPHALVKWLAKHHKAFAHVAPTMSAKGEQPTRPSELKLLEATQRVAQATDIAPLLTQLEACSIPLDEQGYNAPAVKTALLANKSELEDVEEENNLILKQLFHVQEELERYYLDNQELKQDSQKLKDQIQNKKELQDLLAKSQKAILDLKSGKANRSFIKRLIGSFKKLSRKSRLVRYHISVVETSDLFDSDWYLRHNPDVAVNFPSPAEHFVRHGGQEGRAPSPAFSSKSYLQNNPDVADSGQNPLVHYLLHGRSEGREL